VSLKEWSESGLINREIRLYKELSKRGISITFITFGDTSDRELQYLLSDIKIVPIYERIKKSKFFIIRFLKSFFIPFYFRELLSSTDLFKTNQVWGGWIAVICKIFFGKPLLARCGYEYYSFAMKQGCSRSFSWLAYITSWITYHSAERIHLASGEDASYVKSKFWVKKNKINVRPNWIDTDYFKPSNSNKCYDVLMVGRLCAQKQIHLAVDALHGTEYRLKIIGKGELEAEIKENLQEKNIRYELVDKVPNHEMASIYQKSKIYIITSKYEGNPKSLLEAMSCGLPVIGTNVNGIREVIENNSNGLIVKECKTSIRKAIDLIINDENLSNRMAYNARKSILTNNAFEKSIRTEIEDYNSIKSND
jgi:glycosyltransferase involved in cell wall biosynthesis